MEFTKEDLFFDTVMLVIFIIALTFKLFGVINWSWFQVFYPMIGIGIYTSFAVVLTLCGLDF